MPISPQPLAAAAEAISAKTPIGTVLRSAQLAKLPAELWRTGQLSSAVESLRVLQAIQERMEGLLKMEAEQLASGKEATFDRSSFIDAVGKIAREEGLTPADPDLRGGMQDITSIPRLGLIYDMQEAQAFGRGKFEGDQLEGALLLYPAQELTPSTARVPRQDWEERFAAACAAAGDYLALGVLRSTGRMVALKTSLVWEKLSRFGNPWPPFDYGSTRQLADIDREETISLGLMSADAELQPIAADRETRIAASVQGLGSAYLEKLQAWFGDQIEITGDTAMWRNAA
jgi:hypothetical protein